MTLVIVSPRGQGHIAVLLKYLNLCSLNYTVYIYSVLIVNLLPTAYEAVPLGAWCLLPWLLGKIVKCLCLFVCWGGGGGEEAVKLCILGIGQWVLVLCTIKGTTHQYFVVAVVLEHFDCSLLLFM